MPVITDGQRLWSQLSLFDFTGERAGFVEYQRHAEVMNDFLIQWPRLFCIQELHAVNKCAQNFLVERALGITPVISIYELKVRLVDAI